MGPYTKRGLLMAEGKTIKNKQEILNLLAALWLPKKLAIIHCPGHQKAETPIARGNRRADLAAREAALEATTILATQLPDPGLPTLSDQPHYSQEDLRLIHRFPVTKRVDNW
jgi:hypothetical protein